MGVLTDLIKHPVEFPALVRVKLAADRAKRLPKDKALAFCYEMLNLVSRSFAIVIQQLPQELKDAVCIFYLVLRGLDTIEDDMAIPQDIKIPELLTFHEKIFDPTYTRSCGEKHYRRLMANFFLVTEAFLKLKPMYQEIIKEITRAMGKGMADFIPKKVETVGDYNQYCFYVAGLVGVGLSQLYAKSGLESEEILAYDTIGSLSDSMGKFLQKTNIIRDYLEDIMEIPAPRMFWPRDVWSKYAKQLEDFKLLEYPDNEDDALNCLNELITNALTHVPDCLEYMKQVKDPNLFAFTAIPQVMAIATLGKCYDNPMVFKGVVKIRRGLAAKLTVSTRSMRDVYIQFARYSDQIASKIRISVRETWTMDKNAEATLTAVEKIQELCAGGLREIKSEQEIMQGTYWCMCVA